MPLNEIARIALENEAIRGERRAQDHDAQADMLEEEAAYHRRTAAEERVAAAALRSPEESV